MSEQNELERYKELIMLDDDDIIDKAVYEKELAAIESKLMLALKFYNATTTKYPNLSHYTLELLKNQKSDNEKAILQIIDEIDWDSVIESLNDDHAFSQIEKVSKIWQLKEQKS